MGLVEEINSTLTQAMKAQDHVRLASLRLLKSALTNRSIEKGHPLDDAEARQVVHTLVKQRRDSIEQFQKAGRTDLVDKETRELEVLQAYLPAAAGPEEIERAVADAMAETGAASMKDLGRVMKAAMSRLAGKTVDGKAVNEAVRRQLSSQ